MEPCYEAVAGGVGKTHAGDGFSLYRVAQLVAHQNLDLVVVGSIPTSVAHSIVFMGSHSIETPIICGD